MKAIYITNNRYAQKEYEVKSVEESPYINFFKKIDKNAKFYMSICEEKYTVLFIRTNETIEEAQHEDNRYLIDGNVYSWLGTNPISYIIESLKNEKPKDEQLTLF